MRLRSWVLSLAVIGSLQLPAAAFAKTYKVDPEHTNVGFRLRHLFTTVQGRFDKFEGQIVFDPSHPEQTKVQGSIAVASINTNVAERDNDLRSPRFFDSAKYPTITFVSSGTAKVTKNQKGSLSGTLTIHGVERPVVLEVSYLGEGKDPWGNVRAGFSGRAKINRKDFGLSWNETLETGGVLVGDEVEIEIEAEGLVEQ